VKERATKRIELADCSSRRELQGFAVYRAYVIGGPLRVLDTDPPPPRRPSGRSTSG
jgi:hypothetical protein